ncbi:MAG: shikimate dehydrogenase [Thermoleophilaceae bacterium]|jgi:shikimate dehydrogenase|nr:shikimate dehydrogenase [Thermoleophilaceae bacterium]
MHNAAYEALGLDWRYLPLPVAPERFEETARALEASGYRGANVTVPHKVAALAEADEATPAAQAIGAANSLTFQEGRILADNTDAGGFLDAVGDIPASALVLGAGGAARAVIWALREGGAEVTIWNRTAARAQELAQEMGVSASPAPIRADILVNCTTAGLDPEVPAPEVLGALGLDGLEPPATVFDLVYRDGETPVSEWGRLAGSRVIDGLEMLVGQGARSFAHWTGHEAPLEVMREAARALPSA